jgi:multiple sugar transport system ATP-binding protein
MADIRLEGLRKEFGDLTAVNDISLQIHDGEFFCLLGPSGCGKTTTLRTIAGLESQTEGDVVIDGDVVNDVRPKNRELAMVFQNHAVYPHLNVFENLAFPLRAKQVPTDEIDDRVRRTANTLGIEDKLQQDTSDLSGGQRQRVALGRAMIRSPRAFLMDEPLSSLDANLRRQMRVELTNLQSELETTVIYVTHDQVEAMTMADRIAVLRDGDIEQVGNPLEVYNNPETTWVGQFLGDPGMNFLPGQVAGGGVELGGGEYMLPVDQPTASELSASGSDVTVGVRPENVIIDERSDLTATVVAVERVGDSTILHLEAGDMEFKARLEAKRATTDMGSEITVGFDERIHFFGPEGDIQTRMSERSPWRVQTQLAEQ